MNDVFWSVFPSSSVVSSPHSGGRCSLCLFCVHHVNQKWWIMHFLLLWISAGGSRSTCACVQLFLSSFSQTSGLISPRPLCFICRPLGVQRPDWLWHRRSKANWINTITHILIVLNVFFPLENTQTQTATSKHFEQTNPLEHRWSHTFKKLSFYITITDER